MNNDIFQSLESIEKEKGIKRDVLLEMLKSALVSACKKTYPDHEEYAVDIDQLSGRIVITKNGKEVNDPEFGRIAAQTARQVIIQKIREAERDVIFNDYEQRLGDIISGSVHRVERRGIIVDLGKAEAILPAREQIPGETYRQGDTIRAFVLRVNKTTKGPEIILSRTAADFVKRLFELEVPEIHDGIVEIKGVARDAGLRTKIAVYSHDDKVDCVGSCVGMRGQRVKNVVRELYGEKIDIVRWSSDAEIYIKNSLSPAELSEVKLNFENKKAEIIVDDEQLSLTIGKKGQNIRLAAQLTGWEFDIKGASQRYSISDLGGVGVKTEELLKDHGIKTVKDIIKLTAEDLEQIPGLGRKTAEKIIAAAQKLIVSGQVYSQRDKSDLLL
ncbi:MAG: transcription termination/antitermination protein NusA [Candidatus Omnitrophica bacterium]|nr:transcription termination/antitermination protein NusA [Candidatus Omnitrophota bacterium]